MKHFAFFLLAANVAYAQSFLGAIKSDFKTISFQELKNEVAEFAKNKKTYLSLGESHLESQTATKINYELLEAFAQNTTDDLVFCSETLSHFLEPYGEKIRSFSKSYKVYEYNGPRRTDFKDCYEGKENYVVYSGFFHQYPFARSFPTEFAPVPVITERGNNILAQMRRAKGIFVTQMEMEYMEFSALKALLGADLDAQEFLKLGAKVQAVVAEIESKMTPLIDSGNEFTSKKAVVVPGSEFTEELYGENNYFMFTNLSYRKTSLGGLKALRNLPIETLQAFLDELKTSRYMFTATMIGPDQDGGMGTVGYPGISKKFTGGSSFLYRRNSEGDKLYVIERETTKFQCFDPKKDLEVRCF